MDEIIRELADGLDSLRNAICPNVTPAKDSHGGYVGSLTEAVFSASESLNKIAESLNGIADAIREFK